MDCLSANFLEDVPSLQRAASSCSILQRPGCCRWRDLGAVVESGAVACRDNEMCFHDARAQRIYQERSCVPGQAVETGVIAFV